MVVMDPGAANERVHATDWLNMGKPKPPKALSEPTQELG